MELETLNRTQKYLLDSFCSDLNEEKFMDLKFIVSKFFNREKGLRNGLEFKSSIKDSFKQIISNIIFNYSLIIKQYSNDPNLYLWQEKFEYYKNYEMYLDTILVEDKSAVQHELDIIVSELKKVLNLSYRLNKQF